MRLVKYLAHAGVASRRAAERLVAKGLVALDGEIVLDPARNVEEHQRVSVDGLDLRGPEPRLVRMLNKPLGVLSTASDPYGRPTVLELMPDRRLRLYPVGRLDADTTGLLLMTNDGELANRLTHPRFHVPKTYRARLGDGAIGEPALTALRTGVRLEDGPTGPASVRRMGRDQIEVTIHEGRNRQVRRMCEAVGHRVLELQRVRFGPLELGQLPLGASRPLDAAEVKQLRALAGLDREA
jgi:23S rRNA pseudouridine2605 synthase